MNEEISPEIKTKGKNQRSPLCCEGCLRWKKFGKQCWYYWEGKKHCTMWTSNWSEVIM